MATIGLRELRQRASDVVRRAENGETIIVTVSGREVAQLSPIRSARWRRWDDVADIIGGAADEDWPADRERIDHTPVDPFER